MSQFSQDVVEAAQAAHRAFFPKGPFASVTLAQWALESGFGKHLSGVNNPFGIKATAAQRAAGKARLCVTKEFVNGAYRVEDLWFADYVTLSEAFEAHARLLALSPIYAAAQAQADVPSYVRAMAKHYATAPNYAEVLLGIIKTYNLEQYDK